MGLLSLIAGVMLLLLAAATMNSLTAHLLRIARLRGLDPLATIAVGVLGGAAAMAGLVASFLIIVTSPDFEFVLDHAGDCWTIVLLSPLGIVLPCLWVWFWPTREPERLTTDDRWRMFVAPFREAGYQLVARLGLRPARTEPTLEAQLNAITSRHAPESATGFHPAPPLHHGPDPPQSVCIHCGAHSYAWLEECVACGRPLPPRVELSELRPPASAADGDFTTCPHCGGITYSGLPRCAACNALLNPAAGQLIDQ